MKTKVNQSYLGLLGDLGVALFPSLAFASDWMVDAILYGIFAGIFAGFVVLLILTYKRVWRWLASPEHTKLRKVTKIYILICVPLILLGPGIILILLWPLIPGAVISTKWAIDWVKESD